MHVACECCGVFGADGEQGPKLEDFAGGKEDRGRGVGLGCESFELEEGDFGFAEEARGVVVVVGGF